MQKIRAADLMAGAVGLLMMIDFALMDAPLKIAATGVIVGTYAAVSSFYNYVREVKGVHGKERLSQVNIILGFWLIFLALFWEIEAKKELIAIFGAIVITLASTYASYYRQERLGRGGGYGDVKDKMR